jgi:hypothetical protein
MAYKARLHKTGPGKGQFWATTLFDAGGCNIDFSNKNAPKVMADGAAFRLPGKENLVNKTSGGFVHQTCSLQRLKKWRLAKRGNLPGKTLYSVPIAFGPWLALWRHR